jgi:hypothetical protein
MTNNKLDGYEGHHAIVESIERLGGDLANISRDLGRIATALERPNEIERRVTAQEREINDAAEEVAQLEPTQTQEPF